MSDRDVRRLLADVFAATAARLDGQALVRRALGDAPALVGATHVLAVGKVALPMWRGLADTDRGARVEALAVADVIGDDAAVIGSGPLSPDPSTFADAQAIIARLGAAVPAAVAAHLAAGARGAREETPKPGDARLANVRYRIIAGPDDA